MIEKISIKNLSFIFVISCLILTYPLYSQAGEEPSTQTTVKEPSIQAKDNSRLGIWEKTKEISKVIESFGMLIIAIMVAFIGFLQYRTSKRQQEVAEEKLKLDLFDRRYKVFDATSDLFFNIMQSGAEFDKRDLPKFAIKTIDATFLFDKTISRFIEKALSYATQLESINIQCNNLPVGAELDNLVKAQMEITGWFSGKFSELQNLFSPYLKFKDLKS